MEKQFYAWKDYLKKIFHDIKTYQYSYRPTFPLTLVYVNRLRKKGAYSCFSLVDTVKFFNADTATFCLAEIYYYIGEYDKSIELLNTLKLKYPYKEDIYYLQHKCYMSLEKHYEAINILESLLKKSSRNKTWIYWANSIKSKDDYDFFKKNFLYYNKFENINNISLINYYAEAALNAGEYSEAISIWKKFKLNATKLIKVSHKKSQDISIDATKSLIDLKLILDAHKINFFIISGTLLGCIREKKILSHDKDIDIGVFESNLDVAKLISIIKKSGFFELMPIRNDKYIKIKHLNGVFIDIFIHYEDSQYYYHRTAKIEWKNQKFSLKKIRFLDHDFWIPEDYKLYLSENYGDDWMIPKVNFDSNFDTPNAKVVDCGAVEVFYEKVRTYQHFKAKYINNKLP